MDVFMPNGTISIKIWALRPIIIDAEQGSRHNPDGSVWQKYVHIIFKHIINSFSILGYEGVNKPNISFIQCSSSMHHHSVHDFGVRWGKRTEHKFYTTFRQNITSLMILGYEGGKRTEHKFYTIFKHI